LWCLQNGYHGDHAYSFEIGELLRSEKKIITVTKESYMLESVNLRLETEWKMLETQFKNILKLMATGRSRISRTWPWPKNA
jgi:hypothetical protein